MIVRIDVIPVVPSLHRVIVAEVVGGFHGQAALGRWWFPSGVLAENERPYDRAAEIVRAQLGLDLHGLVVVGTRAAKVGDEWHLALAFAGAVTGGEPEPRSPVSGFAARTLAELPDQVGFYHRDDVGVLVARYERLHG